MNIYRKRGYVKWVDEDGVKHKVPEKEYDAVQEMVREPSTEDSYDTSMQESSETD